MKKFLLRLTFASAVLLFAFSLSPVSLAQQADQDPAPATPHRSDSANPQQNEAQIPALGESTAHEAKTFSGRIVKENGELVLKDPVTKVSYKLDDSAKARQYVGKQVKVSGKLDMNSNTIHIETIEMLS